MVSHKHVPVSILAIIALVGISVLMLSVSYFNQPAPFAVTYVGKATQAPQNTVVVNLDVGEYIANEVEALTESDFPGLRGGTVHAKGGATDYDQSLRFNELGQFMGGRIVFGRDEQNRVTDFLEFDDAVFKFQIEFGSGLRSAVENGRMRDIEDEEFEMLGDVYSLVEARVDMNTNRIVLRFFGGFGAIEFEDTNYMDDNYNDFGAKVNGKDIDARVKIRATEAGGELVIYSIQYILNANSPQGDLQVVPLHCTREFLQYPTGLLSPNFDICYKGMEGEPAPGAQTISGNEVRVQPSGDDEYRIYAQNTRGQQYWIPLAQLPGMYGNKGRNLVFVEAPNDAAPNINLGDYFMVNSKNDISGSSHVLRYDRFEQNIAYFEDLAGDVRKVTVDQGTMEGALFVGDGTYRFKIGAGNAIAMDQTNDGSINGGEARFVVVGGHMLDLGPGFTVTLITPRRLFDEAVADETTTFDILFGGNIDLNVPSPQGPIFKLASSSGGRRQGMTEFGILFDWDTESDSDSLRIVIPGGGGVIKSGSFGQVFISLEREKLVRPLEVPLPPAKCGDAIITPPEFCDPPGSVCATQNLFQRGVCSNDCKKCDVINPAACGNNVLDPGEQCEVAADCAAGQTCAACKCVALPPSVCGNGVVEPGEQCERAADCTPGMACSGCKCVAPNCQIPGKCRVWGGCGMNDLLMIDGVPSGCVSPYESAAEGVDYCGNTVLARGNRECNYMDAAAKKDCVCPRKPALELPAPIEQVSAWQRFVLWLRGLFSREPALELPAPVEGVVCANAAPCRFWDARCGGKGFEPLFVDGVFQKCVDAYQAASQGIPYCGHKPAAQEAAYCNYMSNDPREKLPCVCR
ncbi:MAG: hypothetical protein C4541_11635 [Candidatus Auribacter fodinae]|uniref:Disintegrin domain-containing protein n=1 Tax=Candidatus Auribacter fodinae TaxID=2093366 RepID=A0A3A4QRY9_9BACT|nr:MAG: hypothetical protein C4541_11635 [Candidatus Auribacter fodinae]